MRHCPECGAGVRRDSAKFCEECGFNVAVGGAGGEPAPASAAADLPLVAAAIPGTVTDTPVSSISSTANATAADDDLTLRFRRPPTSVLWASLLFLMAPFFPWIVHPARLTTGMEIPIAFLWQTGAPNDGFALGLVVLGLGVVVGAAAFVPRLTPVLRLVGSLVVLTATTFVIQWWRYLKSLEAGGQLIAYIGIGVYVVLVAGLMLASAASEE